MTQRGTRPVRDKLLALLAAHPGEIVLISDLAVKMYGHNYGQERNNVINMVALLRKDGHNIEKHINGYRLVVPEKTDAESKEARNTEALINPHGINCTEETCICRGRDSG